jgi:Fur family transcriptional regulator, ferric uptake regulator
VRSIPSAEKLDAAGMARALQRLRDHVKQEGLKASDVREAVARVALGIKGHFSVEELLEKLPELHSSTLYRVLPVLIGAGLLQEAPGQGDGQRYERAFEREHHDHLLCTRCGRVVEFHFETMDQLERDVASRFNFALTNHVHYLYGLCSKCQRPTK